MENGKWEKRFIILKYTIKVFPFAGSCNMRLLVHCNDWNLQHFTQDYRTLPYWWMYTLGLCSGDNCSISLLYNNNRWLDRVTASVTKLLSMWALLYERSLAYEVWSFRSCTIQNGPLPLDYYFRFSARRKEGRWNIPREHVLLNWKYWSGKSQAVAWVA